MNNLGNNIKKFAINLGIGAAVEVVRGWFNEKIKDITPGELYEAVINERDLWDATPSDVKASGIRYKNNFGGLFKKYQHHINTELILKWINEDHPELFSTLINIPDNRGIIWLDRQVTKIKQQIIEM